MQASSTSPPAFSWDDWYSSVGGRTIKIVEVDEILYQIREYQYPKFKGALNQQQTVFENIALHSQFGLDNGLLTDTSHQLKEDAWGHLPPRTTQSVFSSRMLTRTSNYVSG